MYTYSNYLYICKTNTHKMTHYTHKEIEALKNEMLRNLNICFGFEAHKINHDSLKHLPNAEAKLFGTPNRQTNHEPKPNTK